jgi:hypothetical protein
MVGADLDAPAGIDAKPGVDAPPAPRVLYASSDQSLYALDIDAHTTTLIGTMTDTGGGLISIDGLAWLDGMLIGIPSTGDALVTIDPATAQITKRVALSTQRTYYGLSVVPAGEIHDAAAIFAATSDTSSNLYQIDPNGAVRLVGSLGNSQRIAGDLAWIHGHGLYATLEGGSCNPQCIATVDTSTGVATPIRTDAPGDLWGLSGYRGELWTLEGDGTVSTVDLASGALTPAFNGNSVEWWEGAE